MASTTPGPELDVARALVAQRDLTGAAVEALTEAVRKLPIEALAPVKQLLKRFFSEQPWGESDDASLAELFGTGSGSQHLALDDELTLVWGWEHERFMLRVIRDGGAPPADDTTLDGSAEGDLGLTFETEVFPEVTPSPRTIRFSTPPLHTREPVLQLGFRGRGRSGAARLFGRVPTRSRTCWSGPTSSRSRSRDPTSGSTCSDRC